MAVKKFQQNERKRFENGSILLRAILGFCFLLGALGSYHAEAAPRKKAGKAGVREKHISREQTVRSRDQTKLDFDAADIGGQRKAPMGSFLNQNRADKEYDFVKIRLRWTPEMVQSSSSLDTGKAK